MTKTWTGCWAGFPLCSVAVTDLLGAESVPQLLEYKPPSLVLSAINEVLWLEEAVAYYSSGCVHQRYVALWCYPPFAVCANNIHCCWLCSWNYLCWGSANDGLDCQPPSSAHVQSQSWLLTSPSTWTGSQCGSMADLCSVLCVPVVVPLIIRSFELSLHSQTSFLSGFCPQSLSFST